MIKKQFHIVECQCGNILQSPLFNRRFYSYSYFLMVCRKNGWKRKGKKWDCPNCQEK